MNGDWQLGVIKGDGEWCIMCCWNVAAPEVIGDVDIGDPRTGLLKNEYNGNGKLNVLGVVGVTGELGAAVGIKLWLRKLD